METGHLSEENWCSLNSGWILGKSESEEKKKDGHECIVTKKLLTELGILVMELFKENNLTKMHEVLGCTEHYGKHEHTIKVPLSWRAYQVEDMYS